MRALIIPLALMIFFFFLPLQCFTIGDNLGAGIQGAVYRYQMTVQGNSLIPITYEIQYILWGIYQGKTTLSIILWALGSLVLAGTTIFSLISMNAFSRDHLRYFSILIAGSSIIYLASCMVWYGPFLYGPSGVSLPVGILMLGLFALFLYKYQNWIIDTPVSYSDN
jgi:hypothetical protein